MRVSPGDRRPTVNDRKNDAARRSGNVKRTHPVVKWKTVTGPSLFDILHADLTGMKRGAGIVVGSPVDATHLANWTHSSEGAGVMGAHR
jgi:hypothetical protein